MQWTGPQPLSVGRFGFVVLCVVLRHHGRCPVQGAGALSFALPLLATFTSTQHYREPKQKRWMHFHHLPMPFLPTLLLPHAGGGSLFDLVCLTILACTTLVLYAIRPAAIYFWLRDATNEFLKLSVLVAALEIGDKVCGGCVWGVGGVNLV